MARKKEEVAEETGVIELLQADLRHGVQENIKSDLLWLHSELKRIGVSRLSDLESLIAKAE